MLTARRPNGFTIVELLIVIVVIGIIASLAITTFIGIPKRANTTSLTLDVRAMDKAQKQYMAATSGSPLSYDANGQPNDTLAFAANKGNSIIVKLKGGDQYCVYGYNPDSQYPDLRRALVLSSDNTSCQTLTNTPPDGVESTVSIIGERLERYKEQFGSYPRLAALGDIGLVIKPNSGNANQQQLYCRNNTKAIYLQVDPQSGAIYVYDTATRQISQPTDLNKLTLNTTCQKFAITQTSPGYESTGIKTPDV